VGCVFVVALWWCRSVGAGVPGVALGHIGVAFLGGVALLAQGHRSFPRGQHGEEGLPPAALLQIRQDDLKNYKTARF